MRERRNMGALTDTHRLADDQVPAKTAPERLDLLQAFSPERRPYGVLREASSTERGRSVTPLPDVRPHPIVRSWSQRAGLVAQQGAANKWAQQSNQSLARQAELRSSTPVTSLSTNNRPDMPAPTLSLLSERTPMAVQPHPSDTIFGMADELETGIGDTASGLVNEVSNTAPGPEASAEPEAAPDLEADKEEAALMQSAEAARTHDAAAAQELENEQEHDYA